MQKCWIAILMHKSQHHYYIWHVYVSICFNKPLLLYTLFPHLCGMSIVILTWPCCGPSNPTNTFGRRMNQDSSHLVSNCKSRQLSVEALKIKPKMQSYKRSHTNITQRQGIATPFVKNIGVSKIYSSHVRPPCKVKKTMHECYSFHKCKPLVGPLFTSGYQKHSLWEGIQE